MNAAELAQRLGGAKRVGKEWLCRCPAHNDHSPSLSITEKGGKLLFTCRTGCDQQSVRAALERSGAWPRSTSRSDDTDPRFVCAYDYLDESGKLLFQVVRKRNPKEFPQRRPDGVGGWVWKTDGVRRVLYRLPELIEATAKRNGSPPQIYIVEGEKDADRLAEWGLIATCNPGGAGKWRPEYNQHFTGCDVVIIPDNDDVGKGHAERIAEALIRGAASLRVLQPFYRLGTGSDISDWIEAGGSQSDLETILKDIKPLEVPPQPKGRIISGVDFVSSFRAPDWLIDGIVQRGRLYGCTSLTGHGKTAVWLHNSCMIHVGRFIGKLETEPGNVLILAGENPEDLQARMLGMTNAFNLSVNELPYVLPATFPLNEEETQKLQREIKALDVPFSLIIVDTAASFFPGHEENDNVQAGLYGRTLRTLTSCDGNPAVVALCHPVKHATHDNLVPRGGGAFLNELDGNLTLWSEQLGESTVLHWQGKIRGPDFDPLTYRLKSVNTGYQDAKGREFATIYATPIDEMQAAHEASMAGEREDAVLRSMLSHPKRSFAEIAQACGWIDDQGKPEKWRVQRATKNLERDRLVRKFRRRWKITEAGKEAINGDG